MSDQTVVDLSQAIDLRAVMKEAEDKAKQLPEPKGYRILCAIPEQEKEFESGILKPDELIRHDELLFRPICRSPPTIRVQAPLLRADSPSPPLPMFSATFRRAGRFPV